jgi:hemerythrin-like metal-binding protein
MTFQWEGFFETGIEFQDRQHRRLVDMVNEMAPMLSASQPADRGRLEFLLAQLFEYATEHFGNEKDLMRERGLDPRYVRHHLASHAAFVDQLRQLQTAMNDTTTGEIGVTLLRFLSSWLTFHILGEDQLMARQVQLVGNGMPAEQAFDHCGQIPTDDRAQRALLNAVVDLYAVLGERNRTLTEAQRALRAAHDQLEAKVTDRTLALTEALSRAEKMQQQLLQSEKMAAIGQLAAGVAHEINNPVGFVNSNLSSLKHYVDKLLDVVAAYGTLEEGLPADDPRRAQVVSAKKAADLDFLQEDIGDLLTESANGLDRVKKIVADLKDFSHVNEADWQDADINAGIASTLTVINNELKYKAKVTCALGELPQVHCIPSQLNQVFMNLLVNGAQAIEGMGTINVASGVVGESVWIEIADSGKGMPEAVKARIFEPFFTTKPVGQGTGLGLSISWDIIKKHGGTLEVESAAGEGTTFRITLPISGPAA